MPIKRPLVRQSRSLYTLESAAAKSLLLCLWLLVVVRATDTEFDYVNCFSDKATRRWETFFSSAASPTSGFDQDELLSCVSGCIAEGFSYVALQNGNICYCTAGFPVTALVPEDECQVTSCGDGSLTGATGCGGIFFNALYQVAEDTTSCSNNVQDGNEEGVDCGGHCTRLCNLVMDSSFENIFLLNSGSSKGISNTELQELSSWSGAGVIATSGSTYGNGQNAPDGEYYFGWYAGTQLNQTLNSTRPGYSYRLEMATCSVESSGGSLKIRINDEVIDEFSLTDRFDEYFLELDVFETTLELAFECESTDCTSGPCSQACLIDQINMTTIYQCENIDENTLGVYSSDYFSSCSDVIDSSMGTYLCSDDITAILPSTVAYSTALAVPDTYCCASCATQEKISSDSNPSDEYPQCAKEGEQCVCAGTIYFGTSNGVSWAEISSDGSGVACTVDTFGDVGSSGDDAACYCGGYNYVGCYEDAAVRNLLHFVDTADENGLSSENIEKCISECRLLGAPYIALQNEILCFCTYGFPLSAQVSTDYCSSRCGDSDELIVYNCGGAFTDSLFAISVDTYSCSNGIQDGGELGIDCGGKCDTLCNFVSSGSFENIVSTSTNEAVTTASLQVSHWTGSGTVIHSEDAFGNYQVAPDGEYYFGIAGGSTLSQYINYTSPGDSLLLAFSASIIGGGEGDTLQIYSGSPEMVYEVTLKTMFSQYFVQFDVYTDQINLQFSCDAVTTANCLLDAISVTISQPCDDVTDSVIMAYSSDAVASCETAVRMIDEASMTCTDDTSTLFNVEDLQAPNNFCCSSCVSLEGKSSLVMPSSEYSYCSSESTIFSDMCYCNGTIYFGAEGWSNWAVQSSDGSGIGCNVSNFGDPETAFSKTCYCDGDVKYVPSDYIGCFETTEESDFNIFIGSFKNMTLSVCMEMCMNLDKPFFATGFGSECFCSSGYPSSIQSVEDDYCAEPCVGDSTEICGGDWYVSVYQWASETGTCSDGKKDAGEEGVDCGGVCSNKCNLLVNASFEDITDIKNDKLHVQDPGAWVGDSYIVYSDAGGFNLPAADGNYFAALYGSKGLNQTIYGICDGDILDLSYWAAKVTLSGATTNTLKVVSDDLLWELEESVLTTAWKQYNIRIIVDQSEHCCGSTCSFTIGFMQSSNTYGGVIDGVELTIESECDDTDNTQMLTTVGASCEDVINEMLRQEYTCDDPVSKTLTTLTDTGNLTLWDVCCSSCWSSLTSHVSEAANNMYAFCASQNQDCYCEGTIYFGIDNTYAWSYYVSDSLTKPVLCSTTVFDDPDPNSRTDRYCYCDGSVAKVTTVKKTTTSTTTSTKTTTKTTTTKRIPTTKSTTNPIITHKKTTTSSVYITTDSNAGSITNPDSGAAIAVGVIFGILAFGAIVFVVFYVYRRRRTDTGRQSLISGSAAKNLLSSSSQFEMEMPTQVRSSNVLNSSPFIK